jgi:drug/metabolite transporter (DMT)-like permease
VPVELVSTVASSQRPRPLEFVALAATLLWVALALLHPGGIGNEPAPYEGIADDANKWIFVHFSQLVLTPFVAVGMWMLLDGTQSIAATVARASLVIWMVFFSAFDAVAGIAVGVLTRYANSLAGEERQA